jgi:hypothetical protein
MPVLIADRYGNLPGLARVKAWLVLFGPVRTTFLISLLLTLIAVQKGTINRDGMLYVDTARAFLEEGLMAAFQVYPWPFMSILMAWVAQASGLDLETSGYVLSALFMAGACALLVVCARRMFPEAVWHIVLVLLALPGLNGYRDELLREYGCWFFCMLAIWLALRWSDAPRWPMALGIQAALAIAALFRPEALALFPALLFWQWFSAARDQRLRRIAMIGSLPALAFIGMLGLFLSNQLDFSRLAVDFQRFAFPQFKEKARAIAGVLPRNAQEQAFLILFFGSLAIVPLKFLGKIGLFIVPLVYSFVGQSLRLILVRWGVFFWAFLAHYLMLSVFVLEMQFLAGRYVAPLLVFATPLAGYGLFRLSKKFPFWATLIMFLAVMIMIANVIPSSSSKRHFAEAGAWLATNVTETPRVYVESGRVAYHAGWRYRPPREEPIRRSEAELAIRNDAYDWVVLEVSSDAAPVERWLEQNGLHEVKRFNSPDGGSVLIAKPMVVQKELSP